MDARRTHHGPAAHLHHIPKGCASDFLAEVPSATVAAPDHPLAKIRGAISRAALSKHVQLVLTDRSSLTAGREFGVMSPQVWRLADLGAKHAFLRAGLGWGSMPLHMVKQDLADGSLVALRRKAHPLLGTAFSMNAILAERQAAGTGGEVVRRPLEMRFGVSPCDCLVGECAIACLNAKNTICFEVFGLRAHKVFVYFTCLNLSKREHVILSRPSGQ